MPKVVGSSHDGNKAKYSTSLSQVGILPVTLEKARPLYQHTGINDIPEIILKQRKAHQNKLFR